VDQSLPNFFIERGRERLVHQVFKF